MEKAKANGQWVKAYEPQSRITIPSDFKKELNRNKEAAAFFQTLNSASRYAIIFRIRLARTEQTRKKRIKLFIDMLSRKEELRS